MADFGTYGEWVEWVKSYTDEINDRWGTGFVVVDGLNCVLESPGVIRIIRWGEGQEWLASFKWEGE